jgi:hypothetical protein
VIVSALSAVLEPGFLRSGLAAIFVAVSRTADAVPLFHGSPAIFGFSGISFFLVLINLFLILVLAVTLALPMPRRRLTPKPDRRRHPNHASGHSAFDVHSLPAVRGPPAILPMTTV